MGRHAGRAGLTPADVQMALDKRGYSLATESHARLFIASHTLERIAARSDFAAKISRDAGHTACFFEMVAVGLEFLERDGVMLNRHNLRE